MKDSMINKKKYLKKYNNDFINLVKLDDNNLKKIYDIYKYILKIKKKKKKIIIAGNGGSAAIASHFSVDLTKVSKIRSINFNESDLITCFANDYGYENWIKEALKAYHDEGDLVILISASGNSKNMINAAKYINKKNNNLITYTGFYGKNELSKMGKINITVNSVNYNMIENIHQCWLLILIDLLKNLKF